MQQKACAILMACLLAVCGTGSAMATPGDAPLNLIDTCLKRLHKVEHASDTEDEVTLSDSCPELSLQLDNPQLAQLDPALEDDTTLGQLVDVQRSLLSLRTHPTNGRTPALKGLQQLLKKIYQPEKEVKPAVNPVEKMLEWIGQKIREFFKHDNWLTRNLHFENKPGENVIKGMTNIIVVILIVLVLYIIVNELRAASILKLFRHQRGRHMRLREPDLQTADSPLIGMREISELPLNSQVPALLRYTLQYLIDKQVLPRRYNLTNQEFLAILRQKLPVASRDFALLVDSGDRVLYGNKSIAADDATKLYEHVRKIEQIPAKVTT
jgi:hypothetical protein